MTTQRCDIIHIKGNQYFLKTFPLATYWTEKNPKPDSKFAITNCTRGYVATWEITDNILYLAALEYRSLDGDFGLDYIFPDNTGKVKADWYSGELWIPLGEILDHFMDGFEQLFDSDWRISIENGEVIKQRFKGNY